MVCHIPPVIQARNRPGSSPILAVHQYSRPFVCRPFVGTEASRNLNRRTRQTEALAVNSISCKDFSYHNHADGNRTKRLIGSSHHVSQYTFAGRSPFRFMCSPRVPKIPETGCKPPDRSKMIVASFRVTTVPHVHGCSQFIPERA